MKQWIAVFGTGFRLLVPAKFLIHPSRRSKQMNLNRDDVMKSLIMIAVAVAGTTTLPAADHTATQMREMYQIQSAFHRFGSVADLVNGGARDGDYIGTGDPADPSTCPAPSANAGNRGTLCAFFKYVAAAFQTLTSSSRLRLPTRRTSMCLAPRLLSTLNVTSST